MGLIHIRKSRQGVAECVAHCACEIKRHCPLFVMAQLHTRIAELEEENASLGDMASQAEYFAAMLKVRSVKAESHLAYHN